MIFSGRRRFQGDVRVDVRYRIGRRLTWPITARPQSPTRDLSASAMALTLTPAQRREWEGARIVQIFCHKRVLEPDDGLEAAQNRDGS